MEKMNYNIKRIFTSFDQNTAEFYDNHILLILIFIFWHEFGLKPRYFAFHLMENGEVFFKTSPRALKYEISFPL